MSNRAEEYPEQMLCPLVDKVIKDYECLENQAVVNHELLPHTMPERYKQKQDWQKICEQCKYFEC